MIAFTRFLRSTDNDLKMMLLHPPSPCFQRGRAILFSCLLICLGCNQPNPAPSKGADTNSTAASTSTHPSQTEFDFSQIRIIYQPPAPPYLPEAKASSIQGTVVVELTVDTHGILYSAKALAGPIELRPTAEAYALKWKFSPALFNGKPQYARFKMTMSFRLRVATPAKYANQPPNHLLKSNPACITFRSLPAFRYPGSAHCLGADGAASLHSLGITKGGQMPASFKRNPRIISMVVFGLIWAVLVSIPFVQTATRLVVSRSFCKSSMVGGS